MTTDEGRAAPRGPHRHYAWVVVVASLLVEFFGIGFGFFALVASYPTFEALGWSRTTVVFSSTLMIVSDKHLILYLHDLGLDATHAASVKSLMILVAGAGRLLAGLAGTAALGTILGVIKIAYDVGAAAAPLAAAWARDQLGNYDLVFVLDWACALGAVACAVALEVERRRMPAAASESPPRAPEPARFLPVRFRA